MIICTFSCYYWGLRFWAIDYARILRYDFPFTLEATKGLPWILPQTTFKVQFAFTVVCYAYFLSCRGKQIMKSLFIDLFGKKY